MNELFFAAAGFAAGAAATAAFLAPRLRRLRTQRDAWGRNYRAECQRHDATLAQWCAETKRLRAEQAAAAAQIWTLSHALASATAQVEAGRGQGTADLVTQGQGVLSRFCMN